VLLPGHKRLALMAVVGVVIVGASVATSLLVWGKLGG